MVRQMHFVVRHGCEGVQVRELVFKDQKGSEPVQRNSLVYRYKLEVRK